MGRKCGILDCASDSTRSEDIGVTFHKVPMHPDIRPKWLSLCKIPEDKQMMKVIYICSRHFLRADFCNFKGKKYMLRQGVLPSVFPWNKGKLQHKKNEDDSQNIQIKSEIGSEYYKKDCNTEENVLHFPTTSTDNSKEFCNNLKSSEEIPSNIVSTIEDQKIITLDTPTGLLTFTPDEKIEALDFNQTWCPARIVEVDYQENEVLVHFEKYSNKYDEWICMNSNAIRAIQEPTTGPLPQLKKSNESFTLGERCMASWSDSRKFPATINKILDKDSYEVLFDDGFVKVLKSHRITRCPSNSMQSSPLFDPSKCSKQERRDRKRKINISALFGKRARSISQEEKINDHIMSPSEDTDYWSPSWEHGKPIGEESAIETSDGLRKSIIVPDPRIPSKWEKHLIQRSHGASAGKWDSVIVGPDGRKFRSRTEIRAYIDENPHLKLTESMFDFSIYRRSRNAKRNSTEMSSADIQNSGEVEETTGDSQTSLKIPIIDNSFKCPIEGCRKNFRRENLAQMHVKHYHPEYTKFLDSTPNVADLAYARTVGESLDRSPGHEKPIRSMFVKQCLKTTATKSATIKLQQTSLDVEQKPNQSTPKKDQEIIKLLSGNTYETNKLEDFPQLPTLPSGLPPNMYPDIKLKDILNKSDIVPKRDDLNFRSAVKPPGSGIKTLLPVVRQNDAKGEESLDIQKSNTKQQKKKRIQSENTDSIKIKEEIPHLVPNNDQSNIIIEGGEVIKIVRMKREEIINCTCGITEEDGLMIQCELCLCWQHAYCNNIERENQVPEKYVCYICLHPAKQRSSQKHFHDQDWLKHGSLPLGNFHCRDEEFIQKMFEKLKKSHDLSGSLLELDECLHTIKVKIKIAEANNHPKLYLWSKPWDKPFLPEKEEMIEDIKVKHEKHHEDSMLFSLLRSGKDKVKGDLNEFPKIDMSTLMDNNVHINPIPKIPQPEAAIESEDCKINLLDHIVYYQSLIEQRIDFFEQQINGLESGTATEDNADSYPRIRQTTEMIMRDLNILNELSQCNSF